MIEHGRDLGTMEFIFAKGGNLSDMNYVMFDVQDNSWEPLIKAVAERDNSHPDIIRKNAEPFMANRDQRAAQPFMGTAVTSPRQATQQYNTAQRMSNLANYDADPTAMNAMRAGKYGTAAGKGLAAAGRGIMGAGRKMGEMGGRAMAGAKDMGGRALQAVKDSGMGQRMKNFMGAAGRGLSDLRHAPAAAKQAFRDSRARREDEERRNALEGGLGRGSKMEAETERRMVPGSQNFDANMDRARGAINQQLARDFNVNPNTNKKGKPTESVQDAMRREIQEIGDRRAQPKEGFFAGMSRRGRERRAGNQAQAEGAAYAPSNMATDEPERVPLPAGPSTDAEQAANADKVPEPEIEFDMTEPETGTPPQDAGQPMKVEAEESALTDKQKQAMEMFDKVQENKRKRMAMEGGAETTGDLFVDDEGEVINPAQTETATATEPSFGQRFATEAGMKMGAPAGDRVRGGLDKVFGQHQKTPFADRDAAMQAMLQSGVGTKGMTTAGKFSGKSAQAVEAALMEMGFGPAEAKNVAQQAEAGNPDAKEIVEEAIDFDMGEDAMGMKLSEDNHAASWDSVLKGLNVR